MRRYLHGLGPLALAACHTLFPLDEVVPDGPPPPPACPEAGTAPAFTAEITKVLDATCFQYSQAVDVDLAICFNFGVVMEAPIGEPPQVATIDRSNLFGAAINPEGDQLIASRFESSTPTLETFRREGAAWVHAATSNQINGVTAGSPSRGPDARIVVHDTFLELILELQQQADLTWLEIDRYPVADLGPIRPVDTVLQLSPDGLRSVFRTTDGVGYVDRVDRAQRFAGSVELDAPAHASATSLHMTEDCGLLFGAMLDGVFTSSQP